MTCPLAKRLISATQQVPEHYLTVLRSPTKDDQDPDPAAKSNMERFLWNFLALRTAIGPGSRNDSAGVGRSPSCLEASQCTQLARGVFKRQMSAHSPEAEPLDGWNSCWSSGSCTLWEGPLASVYWQAVISCA